ncbi:YolD-like family protein [Paenibacillus thiaminolyticus]|uniref:YolD-like family protein n=1 Tax=Paenibacillus thiaminolyticus TaxID=49283 RepID=UPI0035A5AFC3
MAANREGTDRMSKKLSNNGLWESSRMIIPQHKEALLRHQGEQHRRERPNLDDQAVEELSRLLQWSMENREPVTLQLYDPFERCEVSGIVVDIDMIGQRIRIREGDERRWISVEDILGVLS